MTDSGKDRLLVWVMLLLMVGVVASAFYLRGRRDGFDSGWTARGELCRASRGVDL